MSGVDLIAGTLAGLGPPVVVGTVLAVQSVPGYESMGPVLSGVAQFGSVALVGALLAWEMVYRGPKREEAVSATHKEHKQDIAALTESFLSKMEAHSQRWEAAIDRNTAALQNQTTACQGRARA